MQRGPGVHVGPVFIALGLVLIVLRHPVGRRLAEFWPRHELATATGAAALGVSSVLGGGLAVLAGFGLLERWPT